MGHRNTGSWIASAHGAGVTAPWEYITLDIGVIMTHLVGLPRVDPRMPGSLASMANHIFVPRTLGLTQRGRPNYSPLLKVMPLVHNSLKKA